MIYYRVETWEESFELQNDKASESIVSNDTYKGPDELKIISDTVHQI